MNTSQEEIKELKKNEVFVFGSNLAGQHAGGAAKFALDKFGAILGQSQGLQGKSYALPTLDENFNKLAIKFIQQFVNEFLAYAQLHPELTFLVTKIGCGIAGFTEAEMKPLFKLAYLLKNVHLPADFIQKTGYKVTDKNMQCRGFQYELNKVYSVEGKLNPCNWGIHYCEVLNNCFEYYGFDPSNRVFEVIDHGAETLYEKDKSCTSSIELIRELSWYDVLDLVNTGKGNTGRGNAGDSNAGAFNTGTQNYRIFNKPSKWTYKEFEASRAFQLLKSIDVAMWIPAYMMTDKRSKS